MEIIEGVLDAPLWSILLTVAAVLWYIYATWTFDTWSKQNVKGEKPWPIFGTFLSVLTNGGFIYNDVKLREKHGKIIGSFQSRTPMLDIADPEFLRLAMIKNFNAMPNRHDRHTGTIVDSIMLSLTDDRWRHVRSTLTSTFTSGKLKQMQGYINICGDNLVEGVRETDGKPFDCEMYTKGFSMDAICGTAFGIEINSRKNPEHPMVVNANNVLLNDKANTFVGKLAMAFGFFLRFLAPKLLLKLMGKVGLAPIDLKAAAYFENLTAKILGERGQDTNTKHKDFVQICADHFVEEPDFKNDSDIKFDRYGVAWSTKGLTLTDITANGLIFFLAGRETVSSALNFALYELALNPGIQERAYVEITENMSSDVATYEELSKMEYLDWVINESMRMYPTVSRVTRLVSEDVTIEGIHIPAGSIVAAMIYAIHHDPEIWPEPSKFDPERFSPENSHGRHQCSWLPFGLGNRNCIGMRLGLLEVKIALVKILTNFRVEPCEDTPEKPLKLKGLLPSPVKPIKITAVARKA